jgi:hypothetical protein
MKKLSKIVQYRFAHDSLKRSIIREIIEILGDKKIQLDDDQGSLFYETFDDDEGLMFLSLEINNFIPVVWVGVYEEEYTVELEHLIIEKLLNIFEALEKAISKTK